MSSSVIFKGKDVIVHVDTRDTPTLVVSFSNFAAEASAISAFGDGALQSKGYSAVFLTAAENNWWQSAEMDEACEAIRNVSASHNNSIAYGTSMGGYGALAFGSLAGCNRILAISPQTVISDPAVPLNVKWRDAIASRPIIRDNVPESLGRVVPEIVYDPFSRYDAAHVRWLRHRRTISEIQYPYAGHKLLLTLRQCGILTPALKMWLNGATNSACLAEDYDRTKGLSPRYHACLGAVELSKGNVEFAQTCAEQVLLLGDSAGHDVLVNKITKYIQSQA